MIISDRYGRTFSSLRVSLTAACNYSCDYCVPNGRRLLPAKNELSGSELCQAIKLLVAVIPITKIRITGGEPMVSKKFDRFLPTVADLGLTDISITTNGQLLLKKLHIIRASGLKRINISLDSLNNLRFTKIARGGDLATVLKGIEAVLELGLKVKINMVPLLGTNTDEIVDMLEYCLHRNIELRFIELMRMGHLSVHNDEFKQRFFAMQSILDLIAKHYDFHRIESPTDSTAVRFSIPGRGRFGIIANESEPFCLGCNRLRLSSNGHLYGCLSSAKHYNIRQILDIPAPQAEQELRGLLTAALSDKQIAGFTGETTVMKFIGG